MSVRRSYPLQVLLLSILVLVTLTTSSLLAQDWKGVGRARGSVKSADGQALAGASVSIWYKGQKGYGPVLKADKKGQWAYIGLVSGDFTVVAEAEGYIPAEAAIHVTEYGGPTQPLDIKLRKLEEAATSKSSEGDRLMMVLNSGNEKLKNKDYAGARAAYQEVMAEVKDPAQQQSLKAAIAGTYLDEGKGAEARAIFEELLGATEDPAMQTSYLQRIARAYYIEGNIDASVATLEKELGLHPDDLVTLRLIIDILVASGREKQAEPYMAKLPAGEKVDPNALLNLGITAYNDGDMETAYVKFEAVLKDYPDNADAWYYLGRSQLGRNKVPEAKAALEKFLQLAPNHKNAEEAKQFLSYLQ